MKKLTVFPLCLGCVFAGATTNHAADLKQSKVTQVVNDVQIISAEDQKQKSAAINDIFSMPDILRTGASSRAELVAPDETVTRVGANTIFSFDPANRTIDLKQGSLLFHSPHGKGGGTIHTGSATASVLGSTLIVVATPNGGFKVIALEDSVEVKFLNGLKQKLDPGQMTFVLPGANQLAPIIIFRLDELTANSLLVTGYKQPLPSLPLIQQQIDKQVKLIQSGKISDTGLLAGDNANPNQVQVIDPNTLLQNSQKLASPPKPQEEPSTQEPTPPPLVGNLDAAEAADATINHPSLLDVSIPTPPLHLFLSTKFKVNGVGLFGPDQFSGFVAHNIFVNTPAVAANPLVVDMSPYTHRLDTFAFVAEGDFHIEGSVTFKGLAADDNLALATGGQFFFTPGITVRADVANFRIAAPTSLTFDNVSVVNNTRDININSAAAISFLNNSLASAGGRLIVDALSDISVTDSHLMGNSVTLSTLAGNIIVANSVVDAPSHSTFITPNSISFANSTINSDFVTMTATALSGVSLNNTVLNAASAIAITGMYDVKVGGDSGSESAAVPHVASVPAAASSGSKLITDPAAGLVNLFSLFGSVNITDTSISAHYLTVNSGDGILLDGSGQSFAAEGADSKAILTAKNSLAVNNADLSGFAVVNMAANTINLFNVAFTGTVSLKSLLGIWHNGSGMAGAVNAINVYYDGNLVVAADGSSGLLPGTGITVGTLGGGSSAAVPGSAVSASAWGGSSTKAEFAPSLISAKIQGK